jgi:hypothetical protein
MVHPDAVPEMYKEHFKSEEEFKNGMFLDRRGMAFCYGKPLSHSERSIY